MACVGDELPLAGERAVEPFEHGVEGVGELTQLVARALQRDALGQVLLTCRAGSCGEPVHRPQDASGDDPARDRGEQRDAGQAEQRVGQQVGERRAALRGGAGLDTVGIHRAALLHDVGAEPPCCDAACEAPARALAGSPAGSWLVVVLCKVCATSR